MAGVGGTAAMSGTFVPTYQGLSAMDFVRPAASPHSSCFPMNAPRRLSFYRARNAIYHLCRAFVERKPTFTVIAPDYNSGNEILALRAAGARIHYCHVDRQMQMDPSEVEQLCDRHGADLVYLIHYVGWPQRVLDFAELCRRRELLLMEDCALSLLSEVPEGPLGSFGDWAVFCLYKTLPLPNGSFLVQNGERIESLERLALRDAGSASVAGRTAELLVQRIRGRMNGVGAILHAMKRGMGRVAGALDVQRANVGDIGFNLDEVDLAMSRVSQRLLARWDMHAIRQRRIENYRLLDTQLDSGVRRVFSSLPEGVCPLFFPIVVDDKHAAATALQRRGVDALEFWNESMDGGEEMGPDARFMRAHVLELPLHQDLTPSHISYVARQVSHVVVERAA